MFLFIFVFWGLVSAGTHEHIQGMFVIYVSVLNWDRYQILSLECSYLHMYLLLIEQKIEINVLAAIINWPPNKFLSINCAMCNLPVWLIDWLIDWCLMPTLAILKEKEN